MSSTNRGTRGGDGYDDFASPRWVVHRLLEKCELPGGLWYEPCAGAGNIITAVNQVRSDVTWTASEIQEKYRESLRAKTETLTMGDVRLVLARTGGPRNATVIPSNPPFAIAEEILRMLLRYLPNAIPVFLQRAGWFESTRSDLFRELKPSVFALPERPSFRDSISIDPKTGKMKKSSSDSASYFWWCFDGKGRFDILDSTPDGVRAAEVKERREAERALVIKAAS